MKNKINIFLLFVIVFAIGSCNDERALVTTPDNFQVKLSDYVKVLSDTFVVNVNEKVTFNFPNGCSDEILFYSGESGQEYRFANRTLYQHADSTLFESKATVNTTVNSFDASVGKDYSLVSMTGLGKYSNAEFQAATKTELMKLRATSVSAVAVKDSFIFSPSSKPTNVFVGNLNLAIVAKSADATKNMLSIPLAGITLTNTEIRNYGYVKNGVIVINKKSISYPVILNSLLSAAWGQYAPDSTIAPTQTIKVLNTSAYNWNMGEIGETRYVPTPTIIKVGTIITAVVVIPVNFDSVKLATAYPISVTAPGYVAKKVAAGTAPSEAWLISRGINPSAVTPDPSTIVKKVDQSSVAYYQYIYKERGIYKATFVGLNAGTNGTAKVVREFVIIVKNTTDNF